MAFDIISPHHLGVVLPPKAEVEIFQSTVPLCSLPNHDEAFYDDGVLYCNFADFGLSDIANAAPQVVFDNAGSDEDGDYRAYLLTQKVSARFKDMVTEDWAELIIVAYD